MFIGIVSAVTRLSTVSATLLEKSHLGVKSDKWGKLKLVTQSE